ncbi:MAG: mechanosensitive ion channel family protein [Caldilineales bacterium]|nr:mechanosensitive ion channel family protein [Caldilineales bacterium]
MQLLQSLFFDQLFWWRQALHIGALFLAAWVVHMLAWRIAGRLIRLSRFTREGRKARSERLHTIRGIIANTISALAFTIALLISLAMFVGAANVVWMVGLFSAAFGLGARPLIADFLTGVSFIFEDTFAVGEKVELLEIQGVIERVDLRTTYLRAPTGELYIIPNGEVRVVRNFSRGKFSALEITLKLAAADLARAIDLLEALKLEAVALLPNLLEPWQILSESGVIGQHTELTLLAKARFGKAAEMRPRLLALVQERLAEADIQMAN